jgi:GTPase SAR1 family protein
MNGQNNYDFLFKYIVVGDTSKPRANSDVGKSCFLSRYVEGIFKDDHEPTLGVEFASKVIELEAQIIKTQIWDTVPPSPLRPDRNPSRPSRVPITKAPSLPSWSSILPVVSPSRAFTSGSTK